ncbi:hypothetical protein E4U42_007070 [Claviceps africana]|uniref:non-specific serine/threonine protein kinase n=1 Tax=Claviceps africana TaxID=83212 RepID=A0A8K0NGE6_9HYPO|nr:hypothetical protein E4U42_007070 [Claviceps africana]
MAHPSTIFYLVPLNERALDVVKHPSNRHLFSTYDDKPVLNIDLTIPSHSCSSNTIVTLGRGKATDIVIDGQDISRLQCSFEIDDTTHMVMLHDRSVKGTTHVSGSGNFMSFQQGRPRIIVVCKEFNDIVRLGVFEETCVKFQLSWPNSPVQSEAIIRNRQVSTSKFKESPQDVRTNSGPETVLPSGYMQTRIHTPGSKQFPLRYHRLNDLAKGGFGTVYKAVNVDTGKLLAVKCLPIRGAGSYHLLKREVETLYHQEVEICMNLMEGSVESLFEVSPPKEARSVLDSIVHDTLQALDYMAFHNFIHRDVKPANILYSKRGETYVFQLGDFGLSKRIDLGATQVGTPMYAAPEIWSKGSKQTPAADIWSLFVTVLWVLDLNRFRSTARTLEAEALIPWIVALANDSKVKAISAMARTNPTERATAAQMLVQCWDGKGLTTPLRKVAPLTPGK